MEKFKKLCYKSILGKMNAIDLDGDGDGDAEDGDGDAHGNQDARRSGLRECFKNP